MLEQRSDPDLKRWGFLFTEALLIVASILLAFALDSWWDERKERGEEAEILHGLEEEFLLNRSKLDYRVEQHMQDLEGMAVLLAAANRGSWDASDMSVDQTIAHLIAPPTTDLGNGVLDALISSGRIELLKNRELRASLAAWESVFGEVRDDEEMSRDFVFERVIPYLVEKGVPVSKPMAAWPGTDFKEPRSISDDPERFASFLQDPRFAVILEARMGFKMHTTGEYQAAVQAVDEILQEIHRSEAELESR